VDAEGLELGIAMIGFVILCGSWGSEDGLNRMRDVGDAYACSNNIGDVRRVGSYGSLLSVDDLQ